jgi:hypothetical protein
VLSRQRQTQTQTETQMWDPALAGLSLAGLSLAGLSLAGLAVAALIVVFSVATSASGDWSDPLYLLDDANARAAAMRAVVRSDRCLCFTSARGHVDWTTMGSNSSRKAFIGLYPDDLRLTVEVLIEGDGTGPAVGRMLVEFGDGEKTAWDGVVIERRIIHTYRQPGTYPVKVWFQQPARVSPQLHSQVVEVRAGK